MHPAYLSPSGSLRGQMTDRCILWIGHLPSMLKKGRWSISSDSAASEDNFSQSSASIHTHNHVTPPVSWSPELVTDTRFYSLGTTSSLTGEAWLYCLLEICRSSNKTLPLSEDHCLVTTKWSVSCGARKRNKTHTLNDESHFQFVWDREERRERGYRGGRQR